MLKLNPSSSLWENAMPCGALFLLLGALLLASQPIGVHSRDLKQVSRSGLEPQR